jgi:hypothetical protein
MKNSQNIPEEPELQKESWIDEANQETKKKIMEVEHK